MSPADTLYADSYTSQQIRSEYEESPGLQDERQQREQCQTTSSGLEAERVEHEIKRAAALLAALPDVGSKGSMAGTDGLGDAGEAMGAARSGPPETQS